ncbi:MAG: hypothetical protein GY915_04050 [bacterium]|nr:hypothetical protein [bacterium]
MTNSLQVRNFNFRAATGGGCFAAKTLDEDGLFAQIQGKQGVLEEM